MTDLQAKRKTAAVLVQYFAQVGVLHDNILAVYRFAGGQVSLWNANDMRWVNGKCTCLTVRSSWFNVQAISPEAVLAYQRQKVVRMKTKADAWLKANP